MSQAGRGDIAAVLKRWADTRGQSGGELVELIQPVVVVGDLPRELPFSVAYPWRCTFIIPAGGAGTWGTCMIHHRDGALGNPEWCEITGIQNLSATANFQIAVNTAAAAALIADQTMLPRRLRGVMDLGGLGQWRAFRGTAGAAPTTELIRLTQGELYRLNFAISQGNGELAAFNVMHETANTAYNLYVEGWLHSTTAR